MPTDLLDPKNQSPEDTNSNPFNLTPEENDIDDLPDTDEPSDDENIVDRFKDAKDKLDDIEDKKEWLEKQFQKGKSPKPSSGTTGTTGGAGAEAGVAGEAGAGAVGEAGLAGAEAGAAGLGAEAGIAGAGAVGAEAGIAGAGAAAGTAGAAGATAAGAGAATAGVAGAAAVEATPVGWVITAIVLIVIVIVVIVIVIALIIPRLSGATGGGTPAYAQNDAQRYQGTQLMALAGEAGSNREVVIKTITSVKNQLNKFQSHLEKIYGASSSQATLGAAKKNELFTELDNFVNLTTKEERVAAIKKIIDLKNAFFAIMPLKERVATIAEGYIGTTTQTGSGGVNAFNFSDPKRSCASFVRTVLIEAGIDMPNFTFTTEVWDYLHNRNLAVEVVSRDPSKGKRSSEVGKLQRGDIVWYGYSRSDGTGLFQHIGIYTGAGVPGSGCSGNNCGVDTSSKNTVVMNRSVLTNPFSAAMRLN